MLVCQDLAMRLTCSLQLTVEMTLGLDGWVSATSLLEAPETACTYYLETHRQ
jgi:hypothetical protein